MFCNLNEVRPYFQSLLKCFPHQYCTYYPICNLIRVFVESHHIWRSMHQTGIFPCAIQELISLYCVEFSSAPNCQLPCELLCWYLEDRKAVLPYLDCLTDVHVRHLRCHLDVLLVTLFAVAEQSHAVPLKVRSQVLLHEYLHCLVHRLLYLTAARVQPLLEQLKRLFDLHLITLRNHHHKPLSDLREHNLRRNVVRVRKAERRSNVCQLHCRLTRQQQNQLVHRRAQHLIRVRIDDNLRWIEHFLVLERLREVLNDRQTADCARYLLIERALPLLLVLVALRLVREIPELLCAADSVLHEQVQLRVRHARGYLKVEVRFAVQRCLRFEQSEISQVLRDERQQNWRWYVAVVGKVQPPERDSARNRIGALAHLLIAGNFAHGVAAPLRAIDLNTGVEQTSVGVEFR